MCISVARDYMWISAPPKKMCVISKTICIGLFLSILIIFTTWAKEYIWVWLTLVLIPQNKSVAKEIIFKNCTFFKEKTEFQVFIV